MLEKGTAYMPAPSLLIDADVIDVERGKGHQATAVLMLKSTEGIAQDGTFFFIDKDGGVGVGKDGKELLVGIFLPNGPKQVGTPRVVHHEHLSEQAIDSLQIVIFCFAYHIYWQRYAKSSAEQKEFILFYAKMQLFRNFIRKIEKKTLYLYPNYSHFTI